MRSTISAMTIIRLISLPKRSASPTKATNMTTLEEQIAVQRRKQQEALRAEQQRQQAETEHQRAIAQSEAKIASLSAQQQAQHIDERLRAAQVTADAIAAK